MTAQNPPRPSRDPAEMIEVWAANLEADDVTLAPFMPARAIQATPDQTTGYAARINELIARAQGKRMGIIL